MSERLSAGRVKMDLSDPFPIWCGLSIEGAQTDEDVLRGFSQKDLLDLQYVVNKAVEIAESQVGRKEML